MKWSKLKKELDDDGVKAHERKDFKEYKTKKELDLDLEANYTKWISYPIEEKLNYTEEELEALKLYDNAKNELPEMKSKKARRKFEIFCGGFLFYHDNIVKSPCQDHKIYFKWIPNDPKEKLERVEIQITKTLKSENPNPPPPPPPPPPES